MMSGPGIDVYCAHCDKPIFGPVVCGSGHLVYHPECAWAPGVTDRDARFAALHLAVEELERRVDALETRLKESDPVLF